MRQLGMIGTTFRRAAQADLQRYTLALGDAVERRALHQSCGFQESVVLATCNRVEVVFVAAPGVSVAECRRRLYAALTPTARHLEAGEVVRRAARALHAYEGDGAAEHLFDVAAALDSMNPGEAQILGQVKEAFRDAAALGLAGPRLRLVFEAAFQAAKRIRQTTRLGAGTLSMLSLARDRLAERLRHGQGRLVIVGVGAMATQCGQMFAGQADVRLTFVNRTLAHAVPLATQYGGEAVALTDFLAAPGHVDALVTATAAPSPLFTAAFFAVLPRPLAPPPVLIDLSVQRDIELGAALAAGAVVYDIDRLKDMADTHRKARQGELVEARGLVDEALEAFRRRVIVREMAPVVRTLRAHYRRAVDESLVELQDAMTEMDPRQRAALGAWAQTLVNRLAHVPTVGLKRLAFTHGAEAVETFLAGVAAPADAPLDEEELA